MEVRAGGLDDPNAIRAAAVSAVLDWRARKKLGTLLDAGS